TLRVLRDDAYRSGAGGWIDQVADVGHDAVERARQGCIPRFHAVADVNRREIAVVDMTLYPHGGSVRNDECGSRPRLDELTGQDEPLDNCSGERRSQHQ